jgi:hypothetical protein
MNSIGGLLTVLVGVYAKQNGDWSTAAIVTICIVALSLSYWSIACTLYFVWLRKLKKHGKRGGNIINNLPRDKI